MAFFFFFAQLPCFLPFANSIYCTFHSIILRSFNALRKRFGAGGGIFLFLFYQRLWWEVCEVFLSFFFNSQIFILFLIKLFRNLHIGWLSRFEVPRHLLLWFKFFTVFDDNSFSMVPAFFSRDLACNSFLNRCSFWRTVTRQ
jgi:hypothetical protein